MQQELPYFIKVARTTLGANGSKFIDYDEFLKIYRKDSDGLNFNTEARNGGYYDGYEALKAHDKIFQFHGNLVRRVDIEGISHITNAIDRSKKTTKKGSKKPTYPNNRSYAAQSAQRNFASSRNGTYAAPQSQMNRSYAPQPSQRSFGVPRNVNQNNQAYSAQPSINKTFAAPQPSINKPFAAPQPSINRTYAAPQPSINKTYAAPQPSINKTFAAPQPPINRPFVAQPSPIIIKKVEVASQPPIVIKKVEVARVPAVGYDNRTFAEVLEKVGGDVFKLFLDIYDQGQKNVLRPDALNSIIKTHKMDSNLSLNKLKCFLSLYFPNSFNIFTVDGDSFSIKSKGEKPKSEYQILCHMFKRKIKQQRLSGTPVCQIIGADGDKGVCVYLRPFIWVDDYNEMNKDLERYASMIGMLTPIEFVFKSDRVLYYDNANRKFYRCVVLSGAGHGKVSVFLNDEFKWLVAETNSLYKLPARFYAYHDLCFGLTIPAQQNKIDDIVKCLNACTSKDHSVEISLGSFGDLQDGANIYSGTFGKITTAAD